MEIYLTPITTSLELNSLLWLEKNQEAKHVQILGLVGGSFNFYLESVMPKKLLPCLLLQR